MSIKIEVGGVYTHEKEIFVFEVRRDRMVLYRSYGLSDGAVVSPHSLCSLGTFSNWISRPLTPQERSRLQPGRVDDEMREYIRGLIQKALAAAPDEVLLAEVRRRGLGA
jgi:hypothetical protein